MQTIKFSSARLLKTCPSSLGQKLSPFGGILSALGTCDFDPLSLKLGGVRYKFSKRINLKSQRRAEGEGIMYPGFKYFPRFPDRKDTPYEPSKLFMVKRIRGLQGLPWWEKDLITELKLDSRSAIAIVKNTPRNNANLYRIKHLLEVQPITTPYGMPDNPENGFLKENGEFLAINSLQGYQLKLEEAKEKGEELKKKSVDGLTLKNRLRLKWYSRF